jgi:hypothetical protein
MSNIISGPGVVPVHFGVWHLPPKKTRPAVQVHRPLTSVEPMGQELAFVQRGLVNVAV